MRKKKSMDRLTRWAIEAEKRGMTYGQFSAAVYEGRIKELQEDGEEPLPEYANCPYCGVRFRKQTHYQETCIACHEIWARDRRKNMKQMETE